MSDQALTFLATFSVTAFGLYGLYRLGSRVWEQSKKTPPPPPPADQLRNVLLGCAVAGLVVAGGVTWWGAAGQWALSSWLFPPGAGDSPSGGSVVNATEVGLETGGDEDAPPPGAEEGDDPTEPAPEVATVPPGWGMTPIPGQPTWTPSGIISTVDPAPLPTHTPTPTLTPVPAVPSNFALTLVFSNDTTCNKKGFRFDYEVTLSGDSISLYQVAANITSTGPYDPATGEFTAIKAGLPGTETYSGVITAAVGADGQTVVTMSGTYSYGNDPNVTCVGTWPFSGQTAP